MVLSQTVDIPLDRRVTIDFPREIPTGQARVEFKVIPFPKKPKNLTAQKAIERGLGLGTKNRIDPMEAINRCCGITKQYGISLSGDEFLEMRRQDKELENRLDGSNA